MNSRIVTRAGTLLPLSILLMLLVLPVYGARAQNFDFEHLDRVVRTFSVIVEMKVELSFGTHTNEQEERLLGTVVTEDGLVIFDGSFLAQDDALSSFAGFAVKTTPTSVEITAFDGEVYDAEYVGTDRFTRIGFARIVGTDDKTFTPVRFTRNHEFKVGSWVALYMLLPEYVNPPLAADVGMISALLEAPEKFPLTVGYSVLELASVLFDEQLTPVGVLGSLADPSAPQTDAGGLIESFGEFDIPMLGVITAERLEKLITDPPQRGKIDRAWLGITLQALTRDIAEFLEIDASGGIIVNDVVKGSPAKKAGFRIGDVVYEINGQPIEIDREERLSIFQRRIAQMGAGTSVEFSVFRPGDQVTDSLKVLAILEAAPLAPSDAAEYENKALEFKVRDLVFADYIRLNREEESFKGVVVSELQRGGLATLGGFQIGDVIQRIDNTPVRSVSDAEAVMAKFEVNRPDEVIFFVWRDNKTMFINVKAVWE